MLCKWFYPSKTCPNGHSIAYESINTLLQLKADDLLFEETIRPMLGSPDLLNIVCSSDMFAKIIQSKVWPKYADSIILEGLKRGYNVPAEFVQKVFQWYLDEPSLVGIVLLAYITDLNTDPKVLSLIMKRMISNIAEDDVNISLSSCLVLWKGTIGSALGDQVF